MEVKKKGGELILRHKLKKNELYKISEGAKFQSVTIYRKPQIVKGFSNVCEDGKGILVIDYDNCDISVVKEDYLSIQKLYALPQGYLFRTKENCYHVICLKKFVQPKIFEILQQTRCDEAFKTMNLRNPYRSYVLRLSDKKGSKKPKFIGLIGNERKNYDEISSAHQTLIHKIYKNIPYPPSKGKGDELREVKIQTYETG